MNWRRFFKSNLAKIIGLILIFAVLTFLGGILFNWGLRFRKRSLSLRLSYMIIAVVWVILSIRAVCIKFKFGAIWRGMIEDFYIRQDNFDRDLRKRYTELQDNYPLAVAEYESHCWKQKPRPTSPEIMESALAISDSEWVERELAAKAKVESKLAARRAKAAKNEA